MKKRLAAMLLAVLMIVSLLPVTASAAGLTLNLCNGEGTLDALPGSDPTWGDYVFDGWYDALIGGTKEDNPVSGTYYAHWKKAADADHFILAWEKSLTIKDGVFQAGTPQSATSSNVDYAPLTNSEVSALQENYGISYDASTDTLALDDAVIIAAATQKNSLRTLYFADASDTPYTVTVSGDCQIGGKKDDGSYMATEGLNVESGGLNITGSGSFTLHGDKYAINVKSGDAAISGTDATNQLALTLSGRDECCLYAKAGDISLRYCSAVDMDIYSGYCIQASEDVVVRDCESLMMMLIEGYGIAGKNITLDNCPEVEVEFGEYTGSYWRFACVAFCTGSDEYNLSKGKLLIKNGSGITTTDAWQVFYVYDVEVTESTLACSGGGYVWCSNDVIFRECPRLDLSLDYYIYVVGDLTIENCPDVRLQRLDDDLNRYCINCNGEALITDSVVTISSPDGWYSDEGDITVNNTTITCELWESGCTFDYNSGTVTIDSASTIACDIEGGGPVFKTDEGRLVLLGSPVIYGSESDKTAFSVMFEPLGTVDLSEYKAPVGGTKLKIIYDDYTLATELPQILKLGPVPVVTGVGTSANGRLDDMPEVSVKCSDGYLAIADGKDGEKDVVLIGCDTILNVTKDQVQAGLDTEVDGLSYQWFSAEPATGCTVFTQMPYIPADGFADDLTWKLMNVLGREQLSEEDPDGVYTALYKLDDDTAKDFADSGTVYAPVVLVTLGSFDFETLSPVDMQSLRVNAGNYKLSLKAENADRVILFGDADASDIIIELKAGTQADTFTGTIPGGVYAVLAVSSGASAPVISGIEIGSIEPGISIFTEQNKDVRSGSAEADLQHMLFGLFGCEDSFSTETDGVYTAPYQMPSDVLKALIDDYAKDGTVLKQGDKAYVPMALFTKKDCDLSSVAAYSYTSLLTDGSKLSLSMKAEHTDRVLLVGRMNAMMLEAGFTELERVGDTDVFTGTIPTDIYWVILLSDDAETPVVSEVTASAPDVPSVGCTVYSTLPAPLTEYGAVMTGYLAYYLELSPNQYNPECQLSAEDNGTYSDPVVASQSFAAMIQSITGNTFANGAYVPMMLATKPDFDISRMSATELYGFYSILDPSVFDLSLTAENASQVFLINWFNCMLGEDGELFIEMDKNGDQFTKTIPVGIYVPVVVSDGGTDTPVVSDIVFTESKIPKGIRIDRSTMTELGGETADAFALSKTDPDKAYGCRITIPANECIPQQTMMTDFILLDHVEEPPAPVYHDPAVTVPVTGNLGSIKVEVTVSGSTAAIADVTSAQIAKIVDGGNLTFDLSRLNKSVTGLTVPKTTLENIAESAASALEVRLPNGTVAVFDKTAVAAVAEQAEGESIRLVVDRTDKARQSLTDAQQGAVRELEDALIVEAYIVSGGKRIADFKGGEAELTVSYPTAGPVCVWYIAEDGTGTLVPSTFDGTAVTFTVGHFSHYAIGSYDACPQDETCVYAKFTDADTGAWYHDGVHFCVENGYMQGVSETAFAPGGTTTRAQIVTILWRLEGKPTVNYAMSFDDVAAEQWYTEAVRWAQSEKIVSGYDAEHFGPNDPITREQMAAILYRYAKLHEIDVTNTGTLAGFTDAAKISSWALDAMKWANAVGLVQGRTTTTLVPDVNITRAEAASMVQRYCENVHVD